MIRSSKFWYTILLDSLLHLFDMEYMHSLQAAENVRKIWGACVFIIGQYPRKCKRQKSKKKKKEI